ncbi:peroxisomal acyl-coenzyme A oxidase 3 [Ochotona princeps]|uniref:peroxisomal acyl-coenzyme A oxidase 3 n=1 Tax=Ochotona princeps TaxID=9978 RepID=UPI0027153FD8|nr:peroxisomal acyl-coenzyme A oxidase 3 [Ochotona princeps]
MATRASAAARRDGVTVGGEPAGARGGRGRAGFHRKEQAYLESPALRYASPVYLHWDTRSRRGCSRDATGRCQATRGRCMTSEARVTGLPPADGGREAADGLQVRRVCELARAGSGLGRAPAVRPARIRRSGPSPLQGRGTGAAVCHGPGRAGELLGPGGRERRRAGVGTLCPGILPGVDPGGLAGIKGGRCWRHTVAMTSTAEARVDALLPDLPPGPLQVYRARASFDWRQLALFLDGEDILSFKKTIFSTLEKDPLFARSPGASPALEKYRELTFLWCRRVFEYDFLDMHDALKSPLKVLVLVHSLGMYDWSLASKFLLHVLVFGSAIYSSGSERHLEYLHKIRSLEIFGCFAMTELSHGSNSRALRTTAHYDPASQEFIIHSPDFEAAKFWVGNMGKSATHAVVFAQLYTADGQCHGLHPFLVQIRDPKTLLPMPGVMVGDIGRKLGQNGLDNGFAMFHKVRIPRENLLNRNGDVTPEGAYVARFKDTRQRLGATLGSLSAGRVCIMNVAVMQLKLAVTIALRFSATRRQFGPTDEEEVAVLEYQVQQWRLLPYLAAIFALEYFSKSLFLDLVELQQDLLGGERSARQEELGREIHALASGGKPLVSWTAQRGIQECREACGGHGYLAMNRLGKLRDDNDPNCTYEGDNNVLLQQTSNYLLGLPVHPAPDRASLRSPLKSVDFLQGYPSSLGQRFTGSCAADWLDPAAPLAAYKWLVCYLLRESHQKLHQERVSGCSDFEARNNCQVYHCRSLALAFMELTVVQRFLSYTHHVSVPSPLRAVLGRLSALYSLWSLSQHTALLYRGGYLSGEQAGKSLEAAILDLCAQLKDDAVALVDTIAPPDFILDSPIGKADGQLYKNLWTSVLQERGVLERPAWWAEQAVHKPVPRHLKAQL